MCDIVTHTESNGIHSYAHNGVVYLRDIVEFPFATIYTDGTSTWVFPTKTRRKGGSKFLPPEAEFVAIVKAVDA